MVTYVLDSSAVLRYLHDEAGAQRVAEVFKKHLAGECDAVMAAPHWGEVAGISCKIYGRREMDRVLSRLSGFGLRVVPADAERSVRAAIIKLNKNLPYVDAFGVELASEGRNHVFVTADFDFKSIERDVRIEFLPAR